MVDPMEKVLVTAFDAARLKAIEAYALLEHCLAGLLSPLLGVKGEAYLVFFRITNTRSRYSIIEDLLKRLNEPEALKFWQNFERKLSGIDQTRNKIVHWLATVDVGVLGADERQAAQKYLRPGHSFAANSGAHLTMEEILKFTNDVNSLAPIAIILMTYLSGHYSVETREALKKIFPQPLTDQTLVELQQCLFAKAPSPPPRSSRG